MSAPPTLFYLIAGEPSGDLLGGRLMAAMRRQTAGRIVFAGIGGPAMIAEGLQPLFPMTELSVMGLAEILPKIPQFYMRIQQTTSDILERRPAALITIDAPDFSFRIAKRVKPHGICCIHYVAPSVWAWRPGRAKRIARFLDRLLALLPFEPPYFEAEGLSCSFVGHSAIEGGAGKGDGDAFRLRHGIAPDRKIVIMLPGSRHGEIQRLLPVFIDTMRLIMAGRGDLTLVVPVRTELAVPVRQALTQAGLSGIIIESEAEKFDAFAAASAALAKSGTVTLELALAGVPSVIAYRINPMTHAIASRIITGKFAGLPNVILDRFLMPEFLQNDCRPEVLAKALGLLIDDSPERQAQIDGMAEIRRNISLGGKMPSEAAAEIVLAQSGWASTIS
jgi:lipid-A-disaccharide synthase